MNELNQAIYAAVLAIYDDSTLNDYLIPLADSANKNEDILHILNRLNYSRQVFQDMSDRLGRLAVAIQVGTQAVIDFQRSLDNEQP